LTFTPLQEAFWREYDGWSDRAREERSQGLLTFIDLYLTHPQLTRHFATGQHTDFEGTIVVHAPEKQLGSVARIAALTMLTLDFPAVFIDSDLVDGTTLARLFQTADVTLACTQLPRYASQTVLNASGEKVVLRMTGTDGATLSDILNIRPSERQLHELPNYEGYKFLAGHTRAEKIKLSPPEYRKKVANQVTPQYQRNPKALDKTIEKFVHTWLS
jgi:hypothetical protein